MHVQTGARIATAPYAGSKLAYLRAVYGEGCTLMRAGRHEDAVLSFRAALEEAPDFADAAQNLGCCLAALGRMHDAVRCYIGVVRMRPGDAGSQFNLGCALLSAGEYGRAVVPLREAARLAPATAKHHQFLGLALIAANRKPDAVPAMMEAVRLDATDATLVATLAGLLVDVGDTVAAVAAGQAAVQLAPGDPFAQANLARALHSAGRSEEALAPALAAVRLAPEDGGAAATLGAVQYMLGQYAEAAFQSRRAALLTPELYQAKANEAVALEALGRVEQAETAAREAIELAPPGTADVRHNLACMLLRSGRMTPEAWGLYESRLQLNAMARALADLPRWAGESVAGKSVLLYAEQGFGDTIQFARYAPMVKALGARVVLAVQPALCRLMQGMPGTDEVVTAQGALPPHDVFCPLLSLPGVFGTTLETIPPVIPIAPDPHLVALLPPSRVRGPQIGIVWAGSPDFVHDRARSVGTDALSVLVDLPGLVLQSLQLPAGSAGDLPVVDLMAGVTDFADTAARIAGLDLVIAVDSAVAHLAAAMGKEVWLLSRFLGCWRWLHDRAGSPWYPKLRLYRQSTAGDWAGVVERVASDLEIWIRRAA